MLNILLILISFAGGIVLNLTGLYIPNAHKGINLWIITIALPAIFLRNIPSINWIPGLLAPIIAPLLVWYGAILFFRTIGYKQSLSKAKTGALILTTGLSNTSFLGFVSVYYPKNSVGIALLYDQSTFILLATLGLVVAIRSSTVSEVNAKLVLYRLLKFPPLMACIAGFILPYFLDYSFFFPLLDKISDTTGPLALFSIGLQLNFSGWAKQWKYILMALSYKHLVAPFMIMVLLIVSRQTGLLNKITVFQAAMPSLASASVLADEYHLEPQFANMIIGASTLLSLATTACWWYISERAF
jgi:predicted permease